MLPCGNSICLLTQTRYIAARRHPERSRTFAPRFRLTVFVAASQFDSLRSLRMTQAQKRETKSRRDLGQQFDIRLRREYALSVFCFAKSSCLAAARAQSGSDSPLPTKQALRGPLSICVRGRAQPSLHLARYSPRLGVIQHRVAASLPKGRAKRPPHPSFALQMPPSPA